MDATRLCSKNMNKKIAFICLGSGSQAISGTEIQLFFKESSEHEITPLLKRFGTNYDSTLESENFDMIAPLMNKLENNSTSGSSLRRWTQEYLSRLITILNGNPPSRSHTKETVKILLEEYLS